MNFTLFKTTDIRGFSLVETMVATFIITTVILGPLTVAFNASTYAKQTKDMITATYLAQESVELLRHQQDSVYIRCADQDFSKCTPINGERPNETAWRIFKERLGNNPQGASCFTTDNANGCAYDFLDMTSNEDSNPTKYESTDNACNTLSYDPITRIYVCTGVRGAGFNVTDFLRTVKITSIPTFGGADEMYNDDLRVTVTVTFRRTSGYIHQVQVVDFLHARA